MINYNRKQYTVTVTAKDGTTRVWPLAEFEANPRLCVLQTGNNFEVGKTEMVAALANTRWQKTQTFTYDGVTTAADAAISPLTAKILAMQITDPQGSATWKLAAGEFRTYTLGDLIALGSAINAHIQACFNNEAALSAAVIAAEVPEALNALDTAMATGWPWNEAASVTHADVEARILAVRTEGRTGRSHYLKAANGRITLIRDGAVVLTFDPRAQGPDEDAYRAWAAGGGVPV